MSILARAFLSLYERQKFFRGLTMPAHGAIFAGGSCNRPVEMRLEDGRLATADSTMRQGRNPAAGIRNRPPKVRTAWTCR